MKNKYLYVHKFIWNDEGGAVMFDNNPKQGKVYFAEDFDKYYRVVLDQTKEWTGVNIYKSEMISDGGSWDCDLEVVNVANLLDLEISSKDLSMMAEDEQPETVMTQGDIADRLMKDMGESLQKLYEFDGDAYEAMVMITTIMAESIVDPLYISLTDGIEQHPHTAKTANVSIAVSELESFINSPDELDMSYLLNAVRQLFIETIRLHKMNKLNA